MITVAGNFPPSITATDRISFFGLPDPDFPNRIDDLTLPVEHHRKVGRLFELRQHGGRDLFQRIDPQFVQNPLQDYWIDDL